MIRYQLECDSEHGFEAWFANSAAYDKQAKRKLVVCPECGSTKVAKSIMAPNVGVKGNRKNSPVTAPSAGTTEVSAPSAALPASEHPKVAEARQELMTAMRKVREIVEKNSEYVGPRFAEEARKIHYKEVEDKGIYGEATPGEVKELIDEGVDVHPLPGLPEDQN